MQENRLEMPNNSTNPNREPSVMVIKKIALMLQNTAVEEISCDQFSDLIDEYADLDFNGENAAELLPLIKLHLDLCGGCHEEYEALMRILNRLPNHR